MAMQDSEPLLRARFGPEALITRLGTIWLVHLDQPSKAEIQEREAEVEQDILEPDECGRWNSGDMEFQRDDTTSR